MSARASGVASPGGFRADIRGANLWDLIQLECLARRRVCVRVASPQGVGFLYFDEGDVVHAATRQLTGEPAALEILGWERGSFAPVETEAGLGFPSWPVRRSIRASYEELLLRAAQRRDEASARVLPFPDPNGASTIENGSAAVPPPIDLRQLDGEVVAAVRLDATGALLEEQGASQELGAVAAYVVRLGARLAEDLGLEPLRELDCRFRAGPHEATDNGRCLLRTGDEGDVWAVQTRRNAAVRGRRAT